MAINNQLLALSAQGAQPRMADAMARGYAQGNAMLQSQQQQETRNSLSQIANTFGAQGPEAAYKQAGQLGQLETAMGLYNGEQDRAYKQQQLNQPQSSLGKLEADFKAGRVSGPAYQAKINAIGKPGTSVTVGQPLTKVVIDQGKGWNAITGDAYKATRDAGQSAQESNRQLDQFTGFLDQGVQTGWAEPWKLQAKRALGVDLQGVAGQEALAALSNSIVVPEVKKLGVNPTDRDLSFIIESTPRLQATTEGNRLMVSAIKVSNARRIAEADFTRQYMRANNQAFKADPFGAQIDMDQAYEEYKAQNPEIFAGAAQQLMDQFSQIGGGAGGKSDQQELDPIFERYRVQ